MGKKKRNRRNLPARPTRAGLTPQDHKPAGAVTDEFYEVEVKGRTWRVMADNLDDLRFNEGLRELTEGNPLKIGLVGKIALGEEQYDDAIKLLADENGRVRTTDFVVFITDLLQGK